MQGHIYKLTIIWGYMHSKTLKCDSRFGTSDRAALHMELPIILCLVFLLFFFFSYSRGVSLKK